MPPSPRWSPLMTEKVLHCIPVYYGVVVSLVFQLVVDAADSIWLFWWIARSHDDGIEPLKTLVGCSMALAIWELYAAFIASVGLWGAIRRKRFMKKFWAPQLFVWVSHLGICIWYIVVYYQVHRDEKVRDCRDKVLEHRSDDNDNDDAVDVCGVFLAFRGAPLIYVWLTFIIDTVIQTMTLYFIWCWRRVLNDYKIVNAEDVVHLADVGDVRGETLVGRPESIPTSRHGKQPSEVPLLPTVDSAARRVKTLP